MNAPVVPVAAACTPDADTAASAAARDDALVALVQRLQALNYTFHCPTPATQARVLARDPDRMASRPDDIFGWNRPFLADSVDPTCMALLRAADGVRATPQGWRSRYRVSRCGDLLLAHSAFPTDAHDSVFFGPDSYRFVRFLETALHGCAAPERIIDIGCGSGVGGLVLARRFPGASVCLNDINGEALRLAAVNARAAGCPVSFDATDVRAGIAGSADLIIANPPYLADSQARCYRDGGGALGIDLAVTIVERALSELPPGGRLLLYTGVPIVDGQDPFAAEVARLCTIRAAQFRFTLLDPDVFGEMLDEPPYRSVERIAAVGLDVRISEPQALARS